ncbi:hypothetical protein F7734_12965 [Scytonema sp. UIC 10036]|uniref:hypothetical protein n=1 Tax=Scytonema sp. UIC 10036 TaxID=2304196 RepID=UPI0012DA4C95|nr:hypothetical protein [Scytonema sp. UIC 10036]MUG93289.1 hypothetical protein [Scytonema sp. UIC 10036]
METQKIHKKDCDRKAQAVPSLSPLAQALAYRTSFRCNTRKREWTFLHVLHEGICDRHPGVIPCITF